MSGVFKNSLIKNSVLNISEKTLKLIPKNIKILISKSKAYGKVKIEISMLLNSVLNHISILIFHMIHLTYYMARIRR